MNSEMLQFLIQVGLPSGLGVFVVYYLLQVHLPREQAMYAETLKAQQKTFRDVIASEQTVHSELMHQLTEQHTDSITQLRETFVDEHTRTRASLDRLTQQTERLSESIFRLQGVEETGA